MFIRLNQPEFASYSVHSARYAVVPSIPASSPQFYAPQSPTCVCGGYCPVCNVSAGLQAKWEAGSPDDHYEREADAVADHVVNRKPAELDPVQAAGIQKKSEMQPRPVHPSSDVNTSGLFFDTGEALTHSFNREFTARMGYDFSRVRIHRDPGAELAAQSLGARAFTIGPHIAFARGEYAPDTKTGKHLLAHELTHVVQQQKKPMLQRKIYTRSGLTIDNYLINKGVTFRKTPSHYLGMTVDRTNLDREILSTMLLSHRNFFVAGTTQQVVANYLDEHVASRKRIIGYTAMKKYRFAAGSGTRVNKRYWGSTGKSYYVRTGAKPLIAYLDLIKSSNYAIACHMATKATMLAGTNNKALVKDTTATSHDWIPGDWGYIQNATFHPWLNDIGEEGENIIYVGNSKYWGHISSNQTYKSLAGWSKLVSNWGVPWLRDWRHRPGNGLI